MMKENHKEFSYLDREMQNSEGQGNYYGLYVGKWNIRILLEEKLLFP